MPPKDHRKNIPVHAAVITVSTTRTEKTDLSGNIIRETFLHAGMTCAEPVLVSDDITQIQRALTSLLSEEINCIVINGGTGITSDDVTIEAVQPMLEKTMDGFGELFRTKSFAQVGTAVLLSRATAGIIQRKAVFCIPGSPNACRLAVEEIIVPEIQHILTHAA